MITCLVSVLFASDEDAQSASTAVLNRSFILVP